METAEQTQDLGFEQRRHEQLRREAIAADIGDVALQGYERRKLDEITSGLAEALSGRIDTHYTFDLVDGQLAAEDGEPIEDLLVRGLRNDIKKASSDPFFEFLPKRSMAELDNFRKAQTMARAETSTNTLLEVSVYTEQFDTSETSRAKLIEAAQKPYWGRTMVRASHWDGQKLHILTLSSDNLPAAEKFSYSKQNSSLSMFKQAVKTRLGYDVQAENSEDLLAESIALNLGSNWQDIPRGLVSEVDSILSKRHGGEWQQGRPAGEAVDLQSYVESQKQILAGLSAAEKRIAKAYTNYEDYQRAFNEEMYNCAALLETRLCLGKIDEDVIDYAAASAGAGAIAASEGKVYDMCGVVISSSEQPNAATQTGSESLDRLLHKKVSCPECSKKVVIPEDDLKSGKLSCNECGYWVDVCSGKKGFIKNIAEKAQANRISGFEIIASWWQKQKQDEQIKKAADKQAAAELGGQVTYLDKKRYEKQIRKQYQLVA